MLYIVELYPDKYFCDIFCSRECAEEVHSEGVEFFEDWNSFAREIKHRRLERGVDSYLPLKPKHNQACFHCRTVMEIKQ